MKENKTKPTVLTVESYIQSLNEDQKQDAKRLVDLFEKITKEPPVIWGTSIIGFGRKIYHYASGRKVDYFYVGFSVRKKAISLYLMDQADQIDLSKLGHVEHGVGCIYVKKLSDIHLKELEIIIKSAVETAKERP